MLNKNYASMLPIMDKLFGTWYMPKKQWPPRYGINSPMAPSLMAELLQPFLPQDKTVRVPAGQTTGD